MTSPWLTRSLLPWMLLACTPSSPPVESESEGSTSDGTDATASGTSTTAPSTEGTGEPTATSTATTTGVDDSSGDTTAGSACDIEALICGYAEGKVPPTDCGSLQLVDDLAAWMAGHECVVQNAAASGAFKLVAELPGIDSNVAEAWGGTVGFVYGTAHMVWDDFGGVPTAQRFDCSTITAVPGCEVTVGNLCLECVEASGGVALCR